MARRVSNTPSLPQIGETWQGTAKDQNKAGFRDLVDLHQRANLSYPKDGTEDFEAPLPLLNVTDPTELAADWPFAEWDGCLLFVDSASRLAYSEGTIWRYVATTADVDAITSTLTETVQDIVGAMLTDSSQIDFTYSDGGGTLTATIKPGSVTATEIDDTHIVRDNATSNFTKGMTATAFNAGTKSSGTYTPAPSDGQFQRAVNGGAHTLAAPSATGDYNIVIQYTNNSSAGTITMSGFTKQTGSALTTTNGDDFMFYITKINGFIHLQIQALQ